jgi:hypothetical protein
VNVAKLLSEQAKSLGRIPVVMLSGGMDSEVVVKAFIEADVPFKIATFRFTQDKNVHEIAYVEQFCKSMNLNPEYYMITIENWIVTNEARTMFTQSQADTFGMVPHMKLMNVIWNEWNGLPVMGNGDMYLEKFGTEWKYVQLEHILAWYRYAISEGILGGLGFFEHTPEIVLSMMREPLIERLAMGEDKIATKIFENSRYVKYKVYKKYWPELANRMKFTGAEMVPVLYHRNHTPLLEARSIQFRDKWTCTFTELLEQLTPLK